MINNLKKSVLSDIRSEYGDEWHSITIKITRYRGEFDEDCPEENISEFKVDIGYYYDG